MRSQNKLRGIFRLMTLPQREILIAQLRKSLRIEFTVCLVLLRLAQAVKHLMYPCVVFFHFLARPYGCRLSPA